MGEIADLMLEGAMCQWCGEFLDGEGGYPTVCAGCQRKHGVNEFGEDRNKVEPDVKLTRKFPCPIEGCKRKLKTKYGVRQHLRMAHSVFAYEKPIEEVGR